MLLRPRKTLYKSSHKKRSFIGSINYNLFNNKFFKKPKYIVSKKEGEYIRKYRINKVLNGFYKKGTVTKII